jgi:hypothetical protein
VERHDVVREQTLQHGFAHVRREHAPVIGLGPRDVHEEVQECIRGVLADGRRRGVQVVVVQHHDRVGVLAQHVQHGIRELPVGHEVPLAPRLQLLHADVGDVREIPQIVLDEPQHGVGDHVVVPLVHLGIDHDEPPRGVDAITRDGECAVSHGGHAGIAILDGGGDPHGGHQVDEPGERRHEPAP